jgi:hypothetical protein
VDTLEQAELRGARRSDRRKAIGQLNLILAADPELASRYAAVRSFSAGIRASEYHLTNACNIRCVGCWFYQKGHNKVVSEARSLREFEYFADDERRRRINCAILIGGEPTLFFDRVAAFSNRMPYVTMSTNGLIKLPEEARFDNVAVMISVFGGGPLDDKLRGIKPNGKPFTGLFETALRNYKGDRRANFVYAVDKDGCGHMAETVERIHENGNTVTFNAYGRYDAAHSSPDATDGDALLAELRRLKSLFPATVTNHDEHLAAIIDGTTEWGRFGFETCPSVSFDHPENAARRANGNPTLPLFNTFYADLKTLARCCTSGHCDSCRDSQAVYSWLMVNAAKYMTSKERLRRWVDMAESYWSQFAWSPYRATKGLADEDAKAAPKQHVSLDRHRELANE